jgi:hypothetical protein
MCENSQKAKKSHRYVFPSDLRMCVVPVTEENYKTNLSLCCDCISFSPNQNDSPSHSRYLEAGSFKSTTNLIGDNAITGYMANGFLYRYPKQLLQHSLFGLKTNISKIFLRQPELQHPIKFQQDQNHSSTHFFFS